MCVSVRMEDDLVCEYDSTWDTESDGDDAGTVNAARRPGQDKNKKAKAGFWSNSSSRNLRAAKDMQNYRHGYPNIIEEDCTEERMPNLKFYLNEINSSPDDVSIETFHNEWKTDYKRLERVHSYIQWLFPLREPGVNYMATELTKKEIQAFRENKEAKRRLVDSYELMLGFYGIQLTDRESGEVKRAENWRERFANLERNMHNNLRITRILKCLGELGFENYQPPLVRFFLEETLVKKNLSSVKRSVLDYFLFAVRDKRERRILIGFAFQHFEPKDKFVWCPRRIQKRFKKKVEKRQESPSRSRDAEREGKTAEAARYEGSSVDPEPEYEGSSVDPLPLNNGSHDENGEMDDSCSDTKGDDGNEDESAETDVNMSSQQDQDQTRIKADAPKDASQELNSGKVVAPSPKHVLPSSPLAQRAEKLPRTEPDVSLTISDSAQSSGDSVSMSPAEEPKSLDANAREQTNVRDKSEPMDTELAAGKDE